MDSPLYQHLRMCKFNFYIFLTSLFFVFLMIFFAFVVIKDPVKVASAEIIFFVTFLSLLFFMARTNSCINAIFFALHFEKINLFDESLEMLKSSDCIKNADEIITLIIKLKYKESEQKTKGKEND